MLVIECQEYADEVRAAAKKMGVEKDLEEQLEYLGGYACHGDPQATRCRLFKDFAPLSFGFVMERRKDGAYVHWFDGGLVYEGPGVPADGSFPSLTVNIGEPKHGWLVHT